MEKNNETQKFSTEKNSKKRNESIKAAATGLAGAVVGGAASAFATSANHVDEKDNEVNTGHDTASENTGDAGKTTATSQPTAQETVDGQPGGIDKRDDENNEAPEQDRPSSDEGDNTNPSDNEEDNIIPEPNPDDDVPYVPAIEIDPNDNDLENIIDDVSVLDVVYDVNGNEMIMARAHDATGGEFYLVDVDADGDFDAVLDEGGSPIFELNGDSDQLVTVVDVQGVMVKEGYLPPTEIDDSLAENTLNGENINDDIETV